MFVEHREAGEVTEAPARTLRLSEAIRIGAKLGPQCTDGRYFGDNNSSCAFGAAGLGMGAHVFAGKVHVATLDAQRAFQKAHGYSILRANDYKGWTREAIADALEALGY